jgi:heme exporter protein CcmD
MGGYAFNVWAVYGLFAIFLVANLWLPLKKRKSIIRNLKRARKRQLQDQ